MQQSVITGPLSMADLLDRTFRLYRKYFAPLALIAAVWLVPISIVQIILTLFFSTVVPVAPANAVLPEWLQSVLTGNVSSTATIDSSWASILGFASGLATIIISLALTYQSVQIVHGQPASLGQSSRGGLRRFWAYIGTVLLIGLAAIPIGIVAALANLIPVLGVLILLAVILLGGYVFGRIFLMIPVLVAEETGPVDALKGSWALTEGYWWRTIGFGLLVGILGWVVSAGPVWTLNLGTSLVLPPAASAGLNTAVVTLIHVLWLPIGQLAYVLYYYDLRVRKYGYDLSLRIDQVAAEADQTISKREVAW